MRVLVVKTSSLGDIIHTLPAISDAMKVYPDIQFDWVVEESMQNIPAWHKALNRVIPIAQRRWRKHKIQALLGGEFWRFIRELKREDYDLIIDAQGLLKSAWITYFARGKRAGYDWSSAREPLASLFYHQKTSVSRHNMHAVQRTRALFAACLNYPLPTTPPDYGICIERLPTPDKMTDAGQRLAKPYLVFLHGTTWATKHWPEHYWIELGKMVSQRGYNIKLMWGNDLEEQRANRIAAQVNTAEVLPKQSLEQAASVIAHAKMIISVDTGLGHLAAALNVPTISIFGPSDPVRTGTYGLNQIHFKVDKNVFACAPCFSRTCLYTKASNRSGAEPESAASQGTILAAATEPSVNPPCFTTVSPRQIMQEIERMGIQQ